MLIYCLVTSGTNKRLVVAAAAATTDVRRLFFLIVQGSEWEKLLIHNIHSCYEISTEALERRTISLASQFDELVKAECADVTRPHFAGTGADLF